MWAIEDKNRLSFPVARDSTANLTLLGLPTCCKLLHDAVTGLWGWHTV